MLVQSLTFILSPDRDPKGEAALCPVTAVYSKTDRQAVQKRFNSAANPDEHHTTRLPCL
jgi:hypothetical protein